MDQLILYGTSVAIILSLLYLAFFSENEKYSTKEDREELANEIQDIFQDVEESDDDETKSQDLPKVGLKTRGEEDEAVVVNEGSMSKGAGRKDLPSTEPVPPAAPSSSNLPGSGSPLPPELLVEKILAEEKEINALDGGIENFNKAEQLFLEEKYDEAVRYYWFSLEKLTADATPGVSKTMDFNDIYIKCLKCFCIISKNRKEGHARMHLFMAKRFILKEKYTEAIHNLKLSQEINQKNIESLALASYTLKKLKVPNMNELKDLVLLVPPR